MTAEWQAYGPRFSAATNLLRLCRYGDIKGYLDRLGELSNVTSRDS